MSELPAEPQLAFTRLFVANQAAFQGYFVAITHDLHAADDLLQDLAGRLWKKFGTYDDGRPFVAWGLGFARLVALEWWRAQQRKPLPLDEETLEALSKEALPHAEQQDSRREALHECMKSLTDHQRLTLHQRYQEDRSVGEIARSREVTEMAVYKILKHAHLSLLGCIQKSLHLPRP